MCWTIVHLLILVSLDGLSCAEDKVTVSCPEYQKALGDSCYEFVGLQHTFVGAQAWCEKRGGHLAFVPDEETQHFLQRHLDSKKDVWLGVAPSAVTSWQYSPTVEGPLSWLDGSQITYSNWVSSPQPGAACGLILGNSGFQWKATRDCKKKLHFICQFESGRSTVCAGHNTALQCGSGQVLMIDGGFYGRKNIHYCRSTRSQSTLTTPTQHQCGWVDVAESLTAHCHGRQVCQISEVMDSFGDPCPQLGSYLSLDYHCKDGLTLSAIAVAAVFDDVTITVKWLLDWPRGNLSCKLSTGDGHVIYLHSPEGLDSTVVYKYIYPSTFVVAVECTSSDIYIVAQKIITIQEPITEFGIIKCCAGKLCFHATNCKALYGEPFQTQMEVKSGTNVTYRIQRDEILLSGLSVVRGNVPQNITVTAEMLKQLGPGCHKLTLYASNMVTFPDVSADLQMCVLEKVAGLQASVLTERDDCLDSADITVGVSLERGAPVLLLFSLAGDNSSFSETREMNSKKDIFHIGHLIQESAQVKLRAWNDFSSLEVDVDMFSSCGHLLRFNKRPRKKRIRVIRSAYNIIATPSASVTSKDTSITLSIDDQSKLPNWNRQYQWSCSNPCRCEGHFTGLTYTITPACLPNPFQFNKYHFNAINHGGNDNGDGESICITFTPPLTSDLLPTGLSFTCTEGCDPVTENKDAKIKMNCISNPCPQVVWNIEDPRDSKNWPDETEECYDKAQQRPLINIQNGGNEYTVNHDFLEKAKSKNRDLTVVITSADVVSLCHKFTIKTSSSSSSTMKPASTTAAGPSTTSHSTTSASTISSTSAGSATTSHSTTSASTVSSTSAGSATTSHSTTSASTISSTSAGSATTSHSTTSASTISSTTAGPATTSPGTISASTISSTSVTTTPTVTTSPAISASTGDTSSSATTVASSSSVDGLTASVENAVAQLKKQGQLSGANLGQIIYSVSNTLNGQSDKSTKADRQKLREQMLGIMTDTIGKIPPNKTADVQAIAKGVSALVQKGTELSSSAQEEASLLFANLSSSLLHMNLNKSEESKNEIFSATSTIVEGASNILDYSSNKNVSGALLLAMTNTQNALLMFKDVNEAPTIIQQAHIGVFVKRVTPGSLHTESINIPNSHSPTFSLPVLPSNTFPSDEPVDIRMLSLGKNPFSWNERGNISGVIGALSLTTKDGSAIPVANLNQDIEILLPRPVEEQVNTSFLDLGNYSTTSINILSADTTLVLKMVPSVDPLPFKLFLGYMNYPTDTNYVAMTDMPQQGKTQEERYTWLLDPTHLKGNTGKYYLVVRPIVGPGIKSINATLSITSITTSCTFWNESALDWSNFGCRVGVKTTPLVTQCLCNHLTFFGSSFFVAPNTVDPSRTAELFGTFGQNPVVVCFVGALFVAYLLVVVWARRKDLHDMAKVKVAVLADNNPMDEYRYLLSVSTGHRRGAATSSQVVITLLGAEGNGEPHHLTDPKKRLFERGAVDMFLITAPFSLGDLQAIRLWHNNSGSHPAWYIGNCMVQDLQTEQKWHFLCNSWLAIDMGDGSLDKVFPVSTDIDMKRFSNLFFMKTTKAFTDGHLWYSVVNRPPSSTFTCVQRVSCCFSLLLCTMLTSIMFYGIPKDPSEQTMELGHFKFTWQQFMIGIQSSFVMFPLNILIVSIFRKTPRRVSTNKHKTKQTDTFQHNVNVTLDIVIEDITRIARLLSKKSNKQCIETEFRPGQQVDINAVLSVVEDFINQNNKTCDTAQSKTLSFPILAQPQLPESTAHVHPGATVEGIQKKSYYLYRQLCHIDKKLSQLGPSGFPNPHSYSQALQQIRGMKGLLEDQLNLDELTQKKKLIPADSAGGNDVMKRLCCHGELPWWFIFVGWLLVIGTSVVAGYYTMLYGLKYGKERSINWLVSMVVSFFHSLLVIQPLKVIGLAVFFSLIIKEVEVEDFRNVPLVENDGNQGDTDQQTIRRDSSLYEPPSPADVEKMKRNKIMNQKTIALLREILIYMGFLGMLLLVAYGRRDPNAFLLNQHIQDSFSREISHSMNLGDVFTWANTSLLNNLFGVYPGFVTDGNSKLVGNARLRQLRVQKNSCQIAGSMLQFVPDCQAPYSWEVEDMGSYDPGWNHSVTENISTSTSSPWKYQTQAQLRAYPVWGEMVLYRGGGFVSELGPDLQNASNTLEYLFRNKWLDTYTRAIFVEFTVYNANVNLFCIVTLLLETTAVGAFQFQSELHTVGLYTSTGDLYPFVMAAEVIYLLFILYYMFLQGKLMKQQRWAYFRSKWNLLELTIILLSWSAVAVFIKRTLLGERDITYYQNHKDKFVSFYETATADSTLQYLIAFLVLLATIKLWRLLRLNPRTNLFAAALQRAWSETSSIIVFIAIMLAAYSIACNVMYGWRMSSYRTLGDALMTIILLQIGIFNYDEVLDSTPLLGGLLFGSCIVFMTFVVLNLLISMVLMAFTQEKKYHKASDEEEIVDLMLKKLFGLFGIRYNNTKDSQGSDVNEGSGLTLNNSRNIINSSTDVKQHLKTHRNP